MRATIIALDQDGVEVSRHKIGVPVTLAGEREMALIRGKLKDMTRSLRACGHSMADIRAALMLEAGE